MVKKHEFTIEYSHLRSLIGDIWRETIRFLHAGRVSVVSGHRHLAVISMMLLAVRRVTLLKMRRLAQTNSDLLTSNSQLSHHSSSLRTFSTQANEQKVRNYKVLFRGNEVGDYPR